MTESQKQHHAYILGYEDGAAGRRSVLDMIDLPYRDAYADGFNDASRGAVVTVR